MPSLYACIKNVFKPKQKTDTEKLLSSMNRTDKIIDSLAMVATAVFVVIPGTEHVLAYWNGKELDLAKVPEVIASIKGMVYSAASLYALDAMIDIPNSTLDGMVKIGASTIPFFANILGNYGIHRHFYNKTIASCATKSGKQRPYSNIANSGLNK